MPDPSSPPAGDASAADVPALAFANAEGAKAWANALPFGNVAQLHDAVTGQLRALATASFTARERATIAEVMRDQVAHLHTELARRYAGTTRHILLLDAQRRRNDRGLRQQPQRNKCNMGKHSRRMCC